jgi:hypothetical protein
MQRINAHLHERNTASYLINLDPAVLDTPYEPNIDVRDTVRARASALCQAGFCRALRPLSETLQCRVTCAGELQERHEAVQPRAQRRHPDRAQPVCDALRPGALRREQPPAAYLRQANTSRTAFAASPPVLRRWQVICPGGLRAVARNPSAGAFKSRVFQAPACRRAGGGAVRAAARPAAALHRGGHARADRDLHLVGVGRDHHGGARVGLPHHGRLRG